MMKALLWKDSRIFVDVLLAGVALLCGSYVLAFMLIYSDQSTAFQWSKVIAGGASLTRFTSLLICALLGAYAFAREGEDRSLLFLTSLPAKRTDVVFSKILVASGSVAAIWLSSLAAMVAGIRAMGHEWSTLWLVMKAMLGYIASGVMAFGGAWFLSLFLGSAVGAAFVGLMFLAPVYLMQFLVNWYFGLDNRMFFHWGTVGFMLAAGLLGVWAGAGIYVRFGTATEEAGLRVSLPWRKDGSDVVPGLGSLVGHKRAVPFQALVWKDSRLIRASLLIGLGITVAPYLIAIVVHQASGTIPSQCRTASLISMALSTLVFAFWSGHIMSAENASGSLAFSSYLPISRIKELGSKLAVTFVPALLLSTANLVLLLATNNAVPSAVRFDSTLTWAAWHDAPFIVMGLGLANAAVMAFSLAWFLSAHWQRPAVAIVLGALATPLSLAAWAVLSAFCWERPDVFSPFRFACLYGSGNGAFVLMLLVAGCFAALRRQRNART